MSRASTRKHEVPATPDWPRTILNAGPGRLYYANSPGAVGVATLDPDVFLDPGERVTVDALTFFATLDGEVAGHVKEVAA